MGSNHTYVLGALLILAFSENILAQDISPPDNTNCRPNAERPRENLESYKLSDLHYVGIIDHQGKRWAILVTPDQKVYRAGVGNYLGRESGCIKAILKEKLIVESTMNLPGNPQRWELLIEN